MIYRVTFSTYESAWKEMSEEGWLALRAAVIGLPEDKAKVYGFEPFFVDWEGMSTIARLGLTVSLADDDRNANLMYVKLQDRIRALEGKVDRDDAAGMVRSGGGVHVHIPDMGLLAMSEVMHLDDACTNDLQGHLDDGWRILAVCPPNAKRRPDYILGRAEPRHKSR